VQAASAITAKAATPQAQCKREALMKISQAGPPGRSAAHQG